MSADCAKTPYITPGRRRVTDVVRRTETLLVRRMSKVDPIV